MRQFAKFVAGLLVVLTAIPALAVAPCPKAMHSMKRCGSECSMMAKPTAAKFSARTGPEFTGPACCSPSSHKATSFVEQRATESGTDLAILHGQAAGTVVDAAGSRELTAPHASPLLFRPSRTTLCTFLI